MRKRWIVFCCFVTAIGLFGLWCCIYFSNIVLPWQRDEAIAAAIYMGGLSQLPVDVANITIEKRGSMFTRQFIVRFTSHRVDKWISESRRLKDKAPKVEGSTRVYEIYPGENGAVGGTVEIKREDTVVINMSWS